MRYLILAVLCNYNTPFATSELDDSDYQSERTCENSSKENFQRSNRDILLNAGVPQNVLNDLSDGQIDFISKNIDYDAVYESYECSIIENGNCADMLSQVHSGISVCSEESLERGQISVSVVSFSVKINGEKLTEIFPSFKWNDWGKGINNDSFAFAVDDGWTARSDYTEQMAVYVNYKDGTQSETPVVYLPCVNNKYGCSYTIPRDKFTSSVNQCYEGHAIMYAQKEKSTARNVLRVKYMHNMSSKYSEYSVTLGKLSISVKETDPVRLGVWEDTLPFRYE